MKFRAYDHFNQKYTFSDKFVTLSAFFAECEKLEAGGNRVTYERATGVVDKNGTEIYEGDRMLAYGHKWHIIFSCGGFVGKYRWEYRNLRMMHGEVIE